jgi:hypothetical protein
MISFWPWKKRERPLEISLSLLYSLIYAAFTCKQQYQNFRGVGVGREGGREFALDGFGKENNFYVWF